MDNPTLRRIHLPLQIVQVVFWDARNKFGTPKQTCPSLKVRGLISSIVGNRAGFINFNGNVL